MRRQRLRPGGAASFEVPVLEDDDGSAQRHGRVEQGVEAVMQNELRRDGLLVSDGADDIEGGKIWQQIGGAGGEPASESVSHSGEAAEVFGEAADEEQRKCEDRRKQRSGE